jgi:pimeloyl-ACP methyl ester carboxylesterase
MNLLPDFLPDDLNRDLAGVQRQVTQCQGAATVWHVWGDADRPVVVLLHGGSGSWTHWVRNIAALREAGWRVLVPDLPGFGDSDLPAGCTDVDDLPVHLHEGLRQLNPMGPVALVGFSFGGMAAALWLDAFPQDAQQLVLVGAPGMGFALPDRIPLKGWRHLPTPEAQNEVHRHNLMALMLQDPTALDGLALSLHAANVQRDRMPRRRLSSTDIVAQALPRLTSRISAMYGEHDALYRWRLPEVHLAMQAWAKNWGQWHSVPEAGHWVQFEASDRFNELLSACLVNRP